MYLDISYQERIQREFEDSSEIQLKDFLKVIYTVVFFAFHIMTSFYCVNMCSSSGGEVQGGE